MRRRRSLSDEEHALWTGFARSIKPLRGARAAVATPVVGDDGGANDAGENDAGLTRPAAPPPAARPVVPPANKAPPLAPLGRRLKQRVARGRESIDARLDLHGLTQVEAHAALLRFLRRVQADGAKIVLVVTGKGTRRAAEDRGRDAVAEHGVLKRQVPMWLSLPEFRPLVIGFEDAHVGHGGQGALYVRLRRAR